MSVCFKFSQLCFCRIAVELFYSWKGYQKIKRVNFFIETQCIIINNEQIHVFGHRMVAVYAHPILFAYLDKLLSSDKIYLCPTKVVYVYMTYMCRYRCIMCVYGARAVSIFFITCCCFQQ